MVVPKMKKNIAGTNVFKNAMSENDKLFVKRMSRGDAGDAHADAHEHEHAGDVISVNPCSCLYLFCSVRFLFCLHLTKFFFFKFSFSLIAA